MHDLVNAGHFAITTASTSFNDPRQVSFVPEFTHGGYNVITWLTLLERVCSRQGWTDDIKRSVAESRLRSGTLA